MTCNTIADLKRLNKEIGHFWFKPDTMRFHKTRIVSTTLVTTANAYLIICYDGDVKIGYTTVKGGYYAISFHLDGRSWKRTDKTSSKKQAREDMWRLAEELEAEEATA